MRYDYKLNESVLIPHKSNKMKNLLYTGDNIHFLNRIDSESVDLIYLDPPFNSKRTYSAPIGSKAAGASFKDMWTWDDVDESLLESLIVNHSCLVAFIQSIEGMHSKAMMSYIVYMAIRIIELHRVLRPTGSLYLHCDPTASHYLKIIMDKIFGQGNFRNEVIWCYDRWEAKSGDFQKMHDVILKYSKTNNYTFHTILEIDSKRQKTLDRGYTTNLLKDGTRQLIVYKGNESRPNIKKLMAKDKFDKVIIKEPTGRPLKDYWNINFIHPKSKERTGYPTQKPLALLDRIIKTSTNEGDTILDPFCGCATTCVSAQQSNRKWIGIDIEAKAAEVLVDRLSDDAGLFSDFIHTDKLPNRTDLPIQKPDEPIKQLLYKEQEGKCNACNNEMRIIDFEIDHILPKSKGGSDTKENYQLLCGNCNRIKGDRPMEYLRTKIKLRDELLSQQITFGD